MNLAKIAQIFVFSFCRELSYSGEEYETVQLQRCFGDARVGV